MSATRVAPRPTSRATSVSRSAVAMSTCMRFFAVFRSGTRWNSQVGSPSRRQPSGSRCPTIPMEAKPLDDLGSRGRSRAAAQNRATISASSQSTVTAATLSVTASPPLTWTVGLHPARAGRILSPGYAAEVVSEYSRQEVTQRAGVDPDYVDRLVELGILTPGAGEAFAPGDVLRARWVQSLERAGVPLEGLAAAVRDGVL